MFLLIFYCLSTEKEFLVGANRSCKEDDTKFVSNEKYDTNTWGEIKTSGSLKCQGNGQNKKLCVKCMKKDTNNQFAYADCDSTIPFLCQAIFKTSSTP